MKQIFKDYEQIYDQFSRWEQIIYLIFHLYIIYLSLYYQHVLGTSVSIPFIPGNQNNKIIGTIKLMLAVIII